MHTDVPEFRGANRKLYPAVADGGDAALGALRRLARARSRRASPTSASCAGGELAFYPDGRERPGRARSRRATTPPSCSTPTPSSTASIASRRDAAAPGAPRRACSCAASATAAGASARRRRDLARYDWDEVRFSVSWKAYCYRGRSRAAARRRARRRPLARRHPRDALRGPARARPPRRRAPGRRRPRKLLIDEYVRFPQPQLA